MTMVYFLLFLSTRNFDQASVYHYDMVSDIQVPDEAGFVLTHEDGGNLNSKATQYLIAGVEEIPGSGCLTG